MTPEKVDQARVLAEKFLEVAHRYQRERFRDVAELAHAPAVRRASMDLTRALSELRKS